MFELSDARRGFLAWEDMLRFGCAAVFDLEVWEIDGKSDWIRLAMGVCF